MSLNAQALLEEKAARELDFLHLPKEDERTSPFEVSEKNGFRLLILKKMKSIL